MCWAHIISPHASVEALLEWIDSIPVNKISAFGGDYKFVDGVFGHQMLARQNVARALAIKVHEGVLDAEKAKKLARMVEKYPKTPFVFVHMMFPDIELAFNLLDHHPELTLDTTNCFIAFTPQFEPLLDAAGGASKMRDIFYEGLCRHEGRVLFGSDHPAGMGSLEQIYKDMESFDLPDSARKALISDAPANFVKSFVPNFKFYA